MNLVIQTMGPLFLGVRQGKDMCITFIKDRTRTGDVLIINQRCKPDTGVSLEEYLPTRSVV
jgi:hypothetical protein